MKKRTLFGLLSLVAVLSLILGACAGETDLRDGKQPQVDPQVQEESSQEPVEQKPSQPQGESMTTDDPTQGGVLLETKPQEADPQPGDDTTTPPTELEITTPGFAPKTEVNAVRVQEISEDKMKFLISKYLPAPGSLSTLSSVHITDLDSMAAFMQEVDSNVFREACAPYDEDFFVEYDLIVIPRVTNTGSMEYFVDLVKEDGALRVSIRVTEPEISTTVMTNWLLVVPVAKADTQGVSLIVGMDHGADLSVPTIGLGE